MLVLSLPSPIQGVWHLGFFPVRAYALCIITGVIAAVWLADRRFVRAGGRSGVVADIALWAVPFGVAGGRIYHVATNPELYFGAGRDPWRALYVWEGGLGIWGAIALGSVAVWIGSRRVGVQFAAIAGAVAPAVPLGQAIGRWGNWFNQELFGRPTTLPWGLRIDMMHRPDGYMQYATFQPTFFYESLWDLALVGVVLWVERRYRVGGPRLFAVYVMGYTLGRFWIESLRIDTANHIWGLRLNLWTCLIVFAAAAIYFVFAPRRENSTSRPVEVRV